MQTQEMYWKQKYDRLEENYNTLKKEYEKKQNIAKTTTGNLFPLGLPLDSSFYINISYATVLPYIFG